MDTVNVLSVCDGMSCLQIALKELNIPVNKYYASEIDKFAIKQTQHNFPNTIQLGDMQNIDVSKLDRIDILGGGTPCTNFSFAGKRAGMAANIPTEKQLSDIKELRDAGWSIDEKEFVSEKIEILTLDHYLELKADGFEFEGQSYLFWEYMRILNDVRKYNPDVLFLLENVEMGNKWERVLSEAIGLFGVHINSALVSAQNRKRIYWTNIRTKEVGLFGELHSDIPQPEDRGILLRDILESDVDEKYYLSDKVFQKLEEHKARNKEKGNGFGAIYHGSTDKMQALKVGGKGIDDLVRIVQLGRGFNKGGVFEDKTPTMTKNSWEQNNLVVHNMMPRSSKSGKGGTGHLKRNDGKTYCLDTGQTNAIESNYRIRRLTPTECARLQTVPSWYEWIVSDTQQYKMLGNGWNIETIKHILKYIRNDNTWRI